MFRLWPIYTGQSHLRKFHPARSILTKEGSHYISPMPSHWDGLLFLKAITQAVQGFDAGEISVGCLELPAQALDM